MNILDKIVAEKRREVAALRPRAEHLRGLATARTDFRDFAAALRGGSRSVATVRGSGHDGAWPSEGSVPTLIAEVKKASPSAGVICANFDAIRIAREYEAAGAAALSVLTDREFFQGNIEFLPRIRAVVKLPLLRKDFIIEELQIYEAAAFGADAVLLIVAILNDAQLRDFRAIAEHLKMAALVEVHNEVELDRAIAAGAAIIGINNRDLRDFSVSLAITEQLVRCLRGSDIPVATGTSDEDLGKGSRGEDAAPTIREERPLIVAESGIKTRGDVERVAKAGVDAILVGESLMRSGDIGKKVKELLGG